MSDMSAKDARNLELAVRELTAELKRQRGVDPDASIADKPQRLTETPPPPPGYASGGIVSPGGGWDGRTEGGSPTYVIPQAVADRLGDVLMGQPTSTGYNTRSMEILSKAMEEQNGNA